MKFSTDRILTTHVGSLPREINLVQALQLKEAGLPHDKDLLARQIKEAVQAIVDKQVEVGVDIANDGEQNRSNFGAYACRRLSGLEKLDTPMRALVTQSRDRTAFAPVYEEMKVMYAARPARAEEPRARPGYICTGPVKYIGQEDNKADIENLKSAIKGKDIAEPFMTVISPNQVAMYYENQYYKSEEEYSIAIADALREEYRNLVDAGIVIQIDDPRMVTHYDRHPNESIADTRKFIESQVEIVNYALKGIPPEMVRFHTCYSTNVAPRAFDLELKDYVDLMLKINAQGYSFEAANPRHDHEWAIFKEVKLPDDKVLIPGVVSHCVALVEHPELVAQRIERYASVVGRERVLASNDCGFATAGAGDEVHPLVAWAKMKALSDGARLASQRLWRKAA